MKNRLKDLAQILIVISALATGCFIGWKISRLTMPAKPQRDTIHSSTKVALSQSKEILLLKEDGTYIVITDTVSRTIFRMTAAQITTGVTN
jgi:hypothetical protein